MQRIAVKAGRLIVAAGMTALIVLTSALPASAASFSVVSEATGAGGPQTAGTLLRLNIVSGGGLVSGPLQFEEPWPTAPDNGLRVRTNKCNNSNGPRDLPIKEVRFPGITGGTDIVVLYPGSIDAGYGTCSYRGLVNLTLVPATQYGGSNRTQVVTIRS